MEELFTLTSLIQRFIWSDTRYFGWCNNEYEFSEDRNTLTFTIRGTGDSIDYKNPHDPSGWEEYCVLTQGFYPLEDDEHVSDLDDGVTPMRTHDYKSVFKVFYLELPPNRKRGDTYTVSQIQKMVVESNWIGDDVPGMGFDYYNCEDDEDE